MATIICRHCDMTSLVPVLQKGHVAKCSRCRSVIYQKSQYSFHSILALCLTSLIIIYPAFTYPLFSMLMLGITEHTSLISGMLMLLLGTDPLVGGVVLFCGVIAPLFLLLTITFSTVCLIYGYLPSYLPKVFKITGKLTHWSMLDVYLLSLMVSIAKLMHYADLHLDVGFYFFVSLILINVAILSAYSNSHYWNKYLQAKNKGNAKNEDVYDAKSKAGLTGMEQGLQVCNICSAISKSKEHPKCCPICSNNITVRKFDSLQKTWALLVAGVIFIIPANLYPITYFLKNNIATPDTIFSGILSLYNSDMAVIATVVFLASIVIPVLKIIILGTVALSVQLKWDINEQQRLFAFNVVEFIGKWSILDLFVISIMVSVFDRGALLAAYTGPGAAFFTLTVLVTLFAANSFDTRLIWDSKRHG